MGRYSGVSTASILRFADRAPIEALENNAQSTVVTTISLRGLLRVAVRSDPQYLDANLRVLIYSFVHVGKTTRGEGVFVNGEDPAQ
jgi:hypothetical protein